MGLADRLDEVRSQKSSQERIKGWRVHEEAGKRDTQEFDQQRRGFIEQMKRQREVDENPLRKRLNEVREEASQG